MVDLYKLKSALRDAFVRESYSNEIVERATTGPALMQAWKKGGKLHRLAGPAFTLKDIKTDTVVYESWERNGIKSRDDGPAVIMRDTITGFVTRAEWWKDGVEVRAPAGPR